MPKCEDQDGACHHFTCPGCGNSLCKGDRFRVSASSMFTVTNEGTEDHEDVEWDDDSYIECKECNHHGTVKGFYPKEEDA